MLVGYGGVTPSKVPCCKGITACWKKLCEALKNCCAKSKSAQVKPIVSEVEIQFNESNVFTETQETKGVLLSKPLAKDQAVLICISKNKDRQIERSLMQMNSVTNGSEIQIPSTIGSTVSSHKNISLIVVYNQESKNPQSPARSGPQTLAQQIERATSPVPKSAHSSSNSFPSEPIAKYEGDKIVILPNGTIKIHKGNAILTVPYVIPAKAGI